MRRLTALVVIGLLVAGCGLRDPYAGSQPVAPSVAVRARAQATSDARARCGASTKAAARAFMRGYLPYLYGLGSARAIACVTPVLRLALAAQPMTREDGASPRRPRLESLRPLAAGGGSRMRAIVSDESGVYFPVELALVRWAGGWLVAALRTGGT